MTWSRDLFGAAVAEARAHPQFRALRDSRLHEPVRALMNDIYLRMGDPNGRFLRDFQAEGFHARAFELACQAYLEEAGFSIDRSSTMPDFLVSGRSVEIAIEATTSNPADGGNLDVSLSAMQQLSDEQIFEKCSYEFPRRMASILQRKLKRRYETLSQCAGKPLVLMVAPFFEPGAPFYSDDGLVDCLYGTAGLAKQPAFFHRREARAVSGVLYCNQFTVPRFLRLSARFHDLPEVTAMRHGTCYLGQAGESPQLAHFEYRVGDPGVPVETWSEGVTLFLNPEPAIELGADALPCTSVFSVLDGRLVREVRGFHPVVSFMLIHVPEGWANRSKKA
jgi:hypothetical protein